MKKTILIMGLALVFGGMTPQAQTATAKKATTAKKAVPTEEEFKKIVDERSTEILNPERKRNNKPSKKNSRSLCRKAFQKPIASR
jgi:hypothetical protein